MMIVVYMASLHKNVGAFVLHVSAFSSRMTEKQYICNYFIYIVILFYLASPQGQGQYNSM